MREPGTTRPVRYRSAWSIMWRGSSPTGTMSGASCSLIICWSMKRQRSWRITYGSSGQSFFPSWGAGLHRSANSLSRAAYASQRLGSAVFSAPRLWPTLTVFTVRQDLHCRWSSVARDESCDALMTIPGRRTSWVSFSAVSSRNWIMFWPVLRVACISGTVWTADAISPSASLPVGFTIARAARRRAASSWVSDMS